jgi:hypothetical protein
VPLVDDVIARDTPGFTVPDKEPDADVRVEKLKEVMFALNVEPEPVEVPL